MPNSASCWQLCSESGLLSERKEWSTAVFAAQHTTDGQGLFVNGLKVINACALTREIALQARFCQTWHTRTEHPRVPGPREMSGVVSVGVMLTVERAFDGGDMKNKLLIQALAASPKETSIGEYTYVRARARRPQRSPLLPEAAARVN